MLALVVLFLVFPALIHADDPVIFLKHGVYAQGISAPCHNPVTGTMRNVWMFLGIPYAEPPIGDLRFQRPIPKSLPSGTLKAQTRRNRCTDSEGGDEDCLFMDIWVPDLESTYPLPVLVWIPGGNFVTSYDITEEIGNNFVTMTDIILVTVSYRRGPFGFLYSAGDGNAPGNVGLLDQQLAIKWVKDHILFFSGDPKNVVLVGDGIGAASVNFHLLSPGSQDLFQNAILMSGTATAPWVFQTKDEAADRYKQLMRSCNCRDFQCLRNVSADVLQRNSHPDRFASSITYRPFPFLPIVDGTFLTGTPDEIIDRGEFKKCNVALGTNSNDGSAILLKFMSSNWGTSGKTKLLTIDDAAKILYRMFPKLSPEVKANILTNYFGTDSYDDKVETVDMSVMLTDLFFVCPAVRLADAYSGLQQKVFVYNFGQTTESLAKNRASWVGVNHGDQIPYVLMIPYLHQSKYTDRERNVTKSLAYYSEYFVAEGAAPNWPTWNKTSRRSLTAANGKVGVVVTNVEDHNCDIWNSIG